MWDCVGDGRPYYSESDYNGNSMANPKLSVCDVTNAITVVTGYSTSIGWDFFRNSVSRTDLQSSNLVDKRPLLSAGFLAISRDLCSDPRDPFSSAEQGSRFPVSKFSVARICWARLNLQDRDFGSVFKYVQYCTT